LDAMSLKTVEMTVLLAHHRLNDIVQFEQRDVASRLKPAPQHRRLDAVQADPELVNLRYGCHCLFLPQHERSNRRRTRQHHRYRRHTHHRRTEACAVCPIVSAASRCAGRFRPAPRQWPCGSAHFLIYPLSPTKTGLRSTSTSVSTLPAVPADKHWLAPIPKAGLRHVLQTPPAYTPG